jgi:hypothetical protein
MLACAVFLAAILFVQNHTAGSKPAWAIGSQPGMGIEVRTKPLSTDEIRQLERYLREVLANPQLRLAPQPPEADVYVGDRRIGVVYPEDDDGDRTFYFEIAITRDDLARRAPAGSKR